MGVKGNEKTPRVRVIIPSRDGFRDGFVPRLKESIAAQTYRDYEVREIVGVSPQGKAINLGVEGAACEILIILDDDSRLADEHVFQLLVDTLDADPTIGMAGAAIVLPPESSRFQRAASGQFPRFNVMPVKEVLDSDMACHGCCAIPTRIFHEVGGEREDIIRGLDPDLRVRLRERGYRVVLAPHARIYHPLPDGWKRLGRIFFRNGFGSAYAWKYQPDSVYETHEKLDAADFQPATSLPYRLLRYPWRLVAAALQWKWMRFYAYVAYALGYAWGLLTAQRQALESPPESQNGTG
jgi:GT2 family glycosyltransferase